jgi:hypothetical protein
VIEGKDVGVEERIVEIIYFLPSILLLWVSSEDMTLLLNSLIFTMFSGFSIQP